MIKQNLNIKRNISNKIKAIFIINNLILSLIAFSFIINLSYVDAAGNDPNNMGTSSTTGSGISGPITTGTTGGIIGGPGGIMPGTTNIPGGGRDTNIPPGNGGGVVIGDNPNNGGSGGIGGGSTPPGNGGTGGGNGGSGGTGGGNGDGGGSGGGGDNGGSGGGGSIVDGMLSFNFQSIITKATFGGAIFGTIGTLAGGDNGALWGGLAGSIGGVVAGLTEQALGPVKSTLLGLAVATIIFLLTYEKKSVETVEFDCLAWQPPIGGEDCQICNDYKDCSEYMCKSLGQACDIVNAGTVQQKCIWKNPHDVNSPIITFTNVSKGYTYKPDTATRPPATGVKITGVKSTCVKPFFPLEFGFVTDEPSQCKIDYNLTKGKEGYDSMSYFVGGDNLFVYNHSEKMSLPSPDALNSTSPELKNNGNFIMYIRCQDANGNINEDSFSVSFCVDKGPDTTPPVLVNVSIPSGNPIQFNQSSLSVEVYVNEPSECKWSKEDRSYQNMDNNMSCDTHVWEMNNNMVYTCRANLTGLESRKENQYYFRCKDQPYAKEADRNENKQSYAYTVIGTQPLDILSTGPTGTIAGATDYVPVFLNVITDNGYKNGAALCYYYSGKPKNDEDYILFLDTGNSNHTQRQDLPSGNYTYYYKCVDLGGNAAYNHTNFVVESDKQAPIVVRAYKDSGELKIMTNEGSECSYSNINCNFEIESGVKMNSYDFISHTAEWKVDNNYYIRCKDLYNNQPNPNTCSIVVRPIKSDQKSDTVTFGSSEVTTG